MPCHPMLLLLDSSIVHCHCMPCHPMLLLQLCIQQEYVLGKLLRALIKTLLKEVPGPLQLGPTISGEELRKIGVPDVVHIRPLEQRYSFLVGLESLLKVVVLLEEEPVVDDDLRGGNLQVQDPVIHSLGGLEGAKALLQVRIEGPDF